MNLRLLRMHCQTLLVKHTGNLVNSQICYNHSEPESKCGHVDWLKGITFFFCSILWGESCEVKKVNNLTPTTTNISSSPQPSQACYFYFLFSSYSIWRRLSNIWINKAKQSTIHHESSYTTAFKCIHTCWLCKLHTPWQSVAYCSSLTSHGSLSRYWRISIGKVSSYSWSTCSRYLESSCCSWNHWAI